MAIEYKDITTVGSASQFSEDATVFINDGGTLKQAPMSLLIGTLSGLDPAALHFRGMLAELPEDVTAYDNGDVVIVGVKEFVLFNGTWYELGDASGSVVDTGTSGLCLVRISAEPGVAYKADRTYAEVVEAIESGKTVLMVYVDGNVYPCMGMQNNRPTFNAGVKITDGKAQNVTIQITEDERVVQNASALKAVNPESLTIKQGSTSKTYDGGISVTAEIPDVLIVKMGSGNASSHTQQEVKNAYYEGKAILLVDPMGRVYTMAGVKDGMPVFHNTSTVKVSDEAYSTNALLVYEARLKEDGKFSSTSPNYSTTPNPYDLTITTNGDKTEYNGSSAVNIDLDAIADVGEGGLFLVTHSDGSLDRTAEEIVNASNQGKTILLNQNGRIWIYSGMEPFGDKSNYDGYAPTFQEQLKYDPEKKGFEREILQIHPEKNTWTMFGSVSRTSNPSKLIVKYGDESTEYDGSVSKTVDLKAILDTVADVGEGGLYLVTCSATGISSRTQEEVRAAVRAGKTCIFVENWDGAVFDYYGEDEYGGAKCPAFVRYGYVEGEGIIRHRAFIAEDGYAHRTESSYAIQTPNPNKLTFTGAVNATYDGSKAVTVNIPFVGEGGSGDGGVSVQSDLAQMDENAPDYVRNRTHYAEDAKTFPWHMEPDQDAPSAIIYKSDGTDSGVRWVKVSDYTPDAEKAVALGTVQTNEYNTLKVSEETIFDNNDNGYLIAKEVTSATSGSVLRTVYAVVCFKSGCIVNGYPAPQSAGYYTATIPEPGLYLPVTSSGQTQSGITIDEYVKPLDDKYIPDTIARKKDLENIEFPDPVTDEHINSLIDHKLAISGGSQTILAETTARGEEGMLLITTPPTSMPVVGNTYTVTYNGTPYDCSTLLYAEEGVDVGVLLGNSNAMGMPGGNPDAPFVVVLAHDPQNIDGALAYGMVMDLAGATSATIAIEGEGGSSNGKTQITLTIDADGNVTSDTPFGTAWAMTPGELQAAIVIKESSNYKGETIATVDAVSKAEGGVVPAMYGGRMINLRIRKAYLDVSDLGDKDTTRFLTWVEGGVIIATEKSYSLPILPVGQQAYVGRYARYNGSSWDSVTIDQLKADLGLT